MIQELLTEKLRPKKFEQLVLPVRVKSALGNGKVQQNVLLHGSPGTGKTSTAKVLAAGMPSLYINVSDESSVDIIRTKITDFCSTISVMDESSDSLRENGLPMKAIILDEIDGASDQFFKALRGTIEKFAKGSRFIATCNFINKVPDAIQSRFEVISFDFANKGEETEVKEEWKNRIKMIMDKLSIKISDKGLTEFTERNFPDMRSALNKIQSFSIQGIKELTDDKIKELNYDFEDLYSVLVKQPNAYDNYQFIMTNYAGKVEDVMGALGNEFIHWIKDKHPGKINAVPQIIIATANHQAQRHQVIDPTVSLMSLCFTVQKLLN